MTPGEVTLAWIIGAGAAITALGVIGTFLVRLWRLFHRADVILAAVAGLPESLAAIREDGDRKSEHLAAIDRHLARVDLQLRPVVYQLQPNGGGSAVDRLARVEVGVAGLYARPGEPGTPGRVTSPIPTTETHS